MTHKYKVGDKVRVTGYNLTSAEGIVTRAESHACMVASKLGLNEHYQGCNDFHLYFSNNKITPITNTLALNTTYTAMNGTSWTCIHLRDNGNAVLDNGISSAEYTGEGKRFDGDSRYDVRLEDDVEEVTWRGSHSRNGSGKVDLYAMTLNLINGKPDWSSAKVEGV